MRQSLAIFLCLMIVSSHAQTFLNNVQNNKQAITSEVQDKNSQFYQLLEEGQSYVIDEVLNLLKNLEDAARSDLAALIKAWQREKALLTKILDAATLAYNNEVRILNRQLDEQHHLEHEILIRVQERRLNHQQQVANHRQIQQLKAERCRANNIYVDHVIAHRNALLLFQVLQKAIDSYKAGSFVELQNISQTAASLKDYVNHFAKQNSEEFNGVMAQLERSLRRRRSHRIARRLVSKRHSRIARRHSRVARRHHRVARRSARRLNRVARRQSRVARRHSRVARRHQKAGKRVARRLNRSHKRALRRASRVARRQQRLNRVQRAQALRIEDTVLTRRGSRVADRQVRRFASQSVYNTAGRRVQRDISHLRKHIDNHHNQIKLQALTQDTVRALATVKGYLQRILAQLIANEKHNRDVEQQNEANANEALATIKSKLQDESRRLQRRNEQLRRQIQALRVLLVAKIAQVKRTRAQVARLLAAKNLAQKNLDDARARFRARKAVLLSEIALFSRLYVYYRERVYAVATKSDRQRVQDYVNTKSFKHTGRARVQTKFNGLNVNKYATEGAKQSVGAFKGL